MFGRLRLRRMSIAIMFVALAMVMTMGTAFAQGGPPAGRGGGGGHGGGRGGVHGGVTHAPVDMVAVSAPTGSSATIGWTTSKGFGSATVRVTANLPVPLGTCIVPYFVNLEGTTYMVDAQGNPLPDQPDINTTGITNPKEMVPAGETGAPYCEDGVWYTPTGDEITSGTIEFAYNQDFSTGFKGTVYVENSAETKYFQYPATGEAPLMLPVKVNPNKGEGE